MKPTSDPEFDSEWKLLHDRRTDPRYEPPPHTFCGGADWMNIPVPAATDPRLAWTLTRAIAAAASSGWTSPLPPVSASSPKSGSLNSLEG